LGALTISSFQKENNTDSPTTDYLFIPISDFYFYFYFLMAAKPFST